MSIYPSNIPDAARLLDTVMPGWASKIDKLDMTSGITCILGQLYGNFNTGCISLFGTCEGRHGDTVFGSRASVTDWMGEIENRCHNIYWAVEQMRKGKIVTRGNMYFNIDGGKIMCNGSLASLSPIDIMATNWRISEVTLKEISHGKRFIYNGVTFTKCNGCMVNSIHGYYCYRDSNITILPSSTIVEAV